MQGTGAWIAAGAIGILGLLGLMAASRATDDAFYYGGWAVAVLCVGYLFVAIHRHYNAIDAENARKRHADGSTSGGAGH